MSLVYTLAWIGVLMVMGLSFCRGVFEDSSFGVYGYYYKLLKIPIIFGSASTFLLWRCYLKTVLLGSGFLESL